jgi:hypothetical protein
VGNEIEVELNDELDYYDIHHELASKLPACGDFGPIALCTIKKESI